MPRKESASTYTAWRLTKARYRASALSGHGGLFASGRWHHKGQLVVYAAENPALALLETFVHIEEADPGFEYVYLSVRFDAPLLEVLAETDLPPDWNTWPWPASTQAIGSRWLQEQRSVVLRVPSALAPQQCNYLINPAHPNAGRLVVGEPKPFPLDPRLTGRT